MPVQRIFVIAAGLGLASMSCGSRASEVFPEEISDLIASAPDGRSRKVLTRCAEEWWPVLAGEAKVPLHVVMNMDYVYTDVWASYPESAKSPEAFPDGEYRIENRHQIWQLPPHHMRVEGPTSGVMKKTWWTRDRVVVYLPEAGIRRSFPQELTDEGWGLSGQLGVTARKLRTAAELGTLAIVHHQLTDESVSFDIGVRHQAAVRDASPVPPLLRLWVHPKTAAPLRALFFGGEVNLDVSWTTLEKGKPIPREVFETPSELGREAEDKEFVAALFGKAFPSPSDLLPSGAVRENFLMRSLPDRMAFHAEVIYMETAAEVDLLAEPVGGQTSDGKSRQGFDTSGIIIEILAGEAWQDVTVTINADLGPEAYSATVEEIAPGRKVTVPYAEFRNPQGVRYIPRNLRFGRTTIRANGQVVKGITWERAL